MGYNVGSRMANPYTDPNEPGFNPAYRGTPPWDIGRPQPDFVRLEEAGEIHGSVLDVGCGTGEHVLYLAQRGHEAWGIDLAPLAIDVAKNKASERQIQATFLVADVFDLGSLGRTFDTIIDSGLLHVFTPDQRPRFVASLTHAIAPGGTYFMLGYADDDPGQDRQASAPTDSDRPLRKAGESTTSAQRSSRLTRCPSTRRGPGWHRSVAHRKVQEMAPFYSRTLCDVQSTGAAPIARWLKLG